MTLTILGSGTSTGVPVVGCDCPVCRSSHPHNQRTRCSALLQWGDYRVLIDTSPDLRIQCLRQGVRRVDAVLYTHGHADHLHGIDDLRPFNALTGETIPVYGSPAVIERLRTSFPYAFHLEEAAGFCPNLRTVEVCGRFELFGRQVEPVILPHGASQVLGYRVGDLAYLTDCHAVPAAAVAQLQGLKVLVIDGLRFRPHASHLTIDQAIRVAEDLGAERVVLTHLSHDVDACRHADQLPAHVEFAFDGLTLPLAEPEGSGR
ncbi:MAG: GPMC system MBL fold metallohydrolase [Desulfuromonadaceae bacterium]|nr:GPMC system MBL fold metallohydrolase [Desulfuromonadaceae bacterium]